MTSFDDVDRAALQRRRTIKWSLHGDEVLAAWVAEMDFHVAPVVRRALIDAIDREDFGYLPADLSELTEACARFISARYGWELPASRIFPVADVLSGIAGCLDVFVTEGASIVVPTPAYPPFFEIIELGGRRIVEVPGTRNEHGAALDLDAIDAALAAGAAAVLLCNPHNPTGRAYSAAELIALSEVVETHGARVISDEVHAPLVYAPRHHVPYASVSTTAAEHAVTLMAASKGWNIPGLRCAQLLLSSHRDAAIWRSLPVFKVHAATPLGIAASTAAYAEGVDWLDELVAYLDANRRRVGDVVAAELPQLGLDLPEATYLAWLDCSALGLDDPAAFLLQEAKVALSDGSAFGQGYEQHLRLNFATSRPILDEILGTITAVVARRG